jgi:hypothetical protein
MTSPTGIPAKISRLVTEAQGAIFKIAETVHAMPGCKPIPGRFVNDDLETVWDRLAAALNEASGYGVVLNLSVREGRGSVAPLLPSETVRVRIDIPAKIFQCQERSGPEKLLPNRLFPPAADGRHLEGEKP